MDISYLTDPVEFVRREFQVDPDGWQEEALKGYAAVKRLSLQGSKGVGVSTVMAWMAWHFIITSERSRVVATSISRSNLEDNLWCEMRLWYARSALLSGALDIVDGYVSPKGRGKEEWRFAMRPFSRPYSEELFAGIFAPKVMIIVDEAGRVPAEVMAPTEVYVSDDQMGRIVVGGVPVQSWNAPEKEWGVLRSVARRNGWWTVKADANPENPHRARRVDESWATRMIEIYGRHSAFVQANVFGEFPGEPKG